MRTAGEHRLAKPSRGALYLSIAGGAALAAGGCPDDPSGTGGSGASSPFVCPYEYVGDPNTPLQMEVFSFGADDQNHPIADGAVIDLLEPPQGGRVIFVGVRAKNVSPCGAKLTGALRDPQNGKLNLDARSVNLVPNAEGWGEVELGDLSSYANTPTCFNSWASQDIDGGQFELEVTLEDNDGQKATATFSVSAACTERSYAQDSGPSVKANCECICQAGYVLGQPCGGGSGGAGGSGAGGATGSGGSGGAGGGA